MKPTQPLTQSKKNEAFWSYLLLLPILLLPILCLSLTNCKKQELLPSPSQEGKQIFGCKIDGKSWVPNGGSAWSGIEAIDGGYYNDGSDNRSNVYIHTFNDDGTKIDLYLQKVTEAGIYQLNYNTGLFPAQLAPSNYGAYFPGNGKAYVTNPEYQGTVTVTRADTINFIISNKTKRNIKWSLVFIFGNAKKVYKINRSRNTDLDRRV